MYELGAAILATGLAYLANRFGVARFGLAEVIWIGPAMEETGKTYLAVWMGAAVWWVHILFGLIEGVWDIWSGAPHGIGAALISVIGHGIFGLLTVWGAAIFSDWWAGVLLGTGAHILWNSYVVIYLVKRYRK
jgi:hypothetical protein